MFDENDDIGTTDDAKSSKNIHTAKNALFI